VKKAEENEKNRVRKMGRGGKKIEKES